MGSLKESFTLPLSEEAHNDKAYFKAVFLIGGTGSGKDFVLDKVLAGHGMTEVDTDSAMELVNDLDENLPEDDTEKRDHFRKKAKSLDHFKRKMAFHGKNGLIINGSGEQYDKHKIIRKALEEHGYETRCIFVACSDEASKQRNIERGTSGGRSMPEFMRKKKWTANSKSCEKYRKLFTDKDFIEFDNSEDLRRAAEDVRQAKAQELLGIFKVMRQFAEKKPEHPKATEWLDNESKRTGQAINFTSSVPAGPPVPAPAKDAGGAKKAKPPTPADVQKALDGHLGGAEDRNSPAAKKARKLGLSYMGYGRYGREGKATHASTQGGQQLGFLAKEESLQELSTPTLMRYFTANMRDADNNSRVAYTVAKSMRAAGNEKGANKVLAKGKQHLAKRLRGGERAIKKLYARGYVPDVEVIKNKYNLNRPFDSGFNEAFESEFGSELNELSLPTLGKYITKAVQSRAIANRKIGIGDNDEKQWSIIAKRTRGIKRATKQYDAKEKDRLTAATQTELPPPPPPPSQAVVFSGPAGVATYQALAIKHALKLYAKTGMKVNRNYTPTNMLRTAGNITGKTYKRGQFQQAIDDLEAWLKANGTNGMKKESLDELSNPLLKRYIQGAWKDTQDNFVKRYWATGEARKKLDTKMIKRNQGVGRALDRLGVPKLNEEFEDMLDEKKKHHVKPMSQYIPVIIKKKKKIVKDIKGAAHRPIIKGFFDVD
jgi:hypothetical protein